MREFEKWQKKRMVKTIGYLSNTSAYKAGEEGGWRAALEMVLKLCPTNEKATFANQGQGMDGYSELANYKAMYEKLKEELKS